MGGPDAAQCVKFEPAGMRIALPARLPGAPSGTGVRFAQAAKGDFDMAVQFELLREPIQGPTKGVASRYSLEAILGPPRQSVAAVSQVLGPRDGKHWQSSVWEPAAPQRQARVEFFPTAATQGRLRITRLGSSVTFYASEGPEGKWTRLSHYNLGPEDLLAIGLNATTGDADAALDVRFTNLELRAESLAGAADSPPVEPSGKGGWAGTGTVIAAMTALLVLIGCLGARAGWFEP
jgi:hypothetical protein